MGMASAAYASAGHMLAKSGDAIVTAGNSLADTANDVANSRVGKSVAIGAMIAAMGFLCIKAEMTGDAGAPQRGLDLIQRAIVDF